MNASFQELTDSQWQVIENILASQRKRRHSLRTICNAILWLNHTGLQWRELDKLNGRYPPWQTVYYHFRQFKLRGIWEELLDNLIIQERKRQARVDTPSLLAIDSQSVKIVQFIEEDTGIDADVERATIELTAVSVVSPLKHSDCLGL